MSAPAFEYEFIAPVAGRDAGTQMQVLLLPDDVAAALTAARVRRLVGTLNGRPFRLALHRRAGARPCLLLSRALLREIRAAPGDLVAVALGPDPEPERVDLGEELEAALAQDAEAAARFNAMTPGRQRSLAHYVTSAKRVETREARALELARKLRTHTLYGDLHPDR